MALIQRSIFLFLLAICCSNTLWAADSDISTKRITAEKYSLLEQLRTAANETEGKYAEDALWQFWFNQAPTKQVRSDLDASLKRRKAYDYEAAEHLLDKVIKNAPNYAEGYNQRSFIRFLRDNHEQAQEDAFRALKLEPNHFGALAGLFHILSKQDQKDPALASLQKAVTLHPWIKERFALPKAMWPDSYKNIHEPGTSI